MLKATSLQKASATLYPLDSHLLPSPQCWQEPAQRKDGDKDIPQQRGVP